MFQLEKAIADWRATASESLSAECLDELESHLRECVEEQQRQGRSPEEAFLSASSELGEMESISREFAKGQSLFCRPLLTIFLITLACAALLPLPRVGGPEVIVVIFMAAVLSTLHRFVLQRRQSSGSAHGAHAVAVMLILFASVTVTPTPDAIVMVAVAVPLIILYSVVASISHWFATRKNRESAMTPVS